MPAVETKPEATAAAKPNPRNPTYSAPSGKSFVIALDAYPCTSSSSMLPAKLAKNIVGASKGDLIELFHVKDGWAFGCRFKQRNGFVSEGAFSLDWVRGLKMCFGSGGDAKPVDVPIEELVFTNSNTIGNRASRMRAKRFENRIRDAKQMWAEHCKPPTPPREPERKSQRTGRLQTAASRSNSNRNKAAGATKRSANTAVSKRLSANDILKEFSSASDEISSPKNKSAWRASWELLAIQLENQMQEQINSVSEGSGDDDSVPAKLRRGILDAKKSGLLQRIANNLQAAQEELCQRAAEVQELSRNVDDLFSDCSSVRDPEELDRFTNSISEQVVKRGRAFEETRRVVLSGLLQLKRSGELERLAQEFGPTQLASAAVALSQSKEKAIKAILAAKRTGQLARISASISCIARELTTDSNAFADVMSKFKGLLIRAHRSGELLQLSQEMRHSFSSSEVSQPESSDMTIDSKLSGDFVPAQ